MLWITIFCWFIILFTGLFIVAALDHLNANMKVVIDHIKNHDESFSYSGTKDFIRPEGDVKALDQKVPVSKPPTQKSKNNSYT
jgi:hypothetical protein